MPKSRGRRPQRGARRPVRRSPMQRPVDVLIREARDIASAADPLHAEAWASRWLGQAWLNSPEGLSEPEHALCTQVCDLALTAPSPQSLAAVAALARVAPAKDVASLTDALGVLARTQPAPPWSAAAERGWTATAAWRAVDVWGSQRVLFIDYDGPHPHTLIADVSQAGGLFAGTVSVIEPGVPARWDKLRAGEEEAVPMPISEQATADVLAELADALRATDFIRPRNDNDDFVMYRALAWSRCRDHLPAWTDRLKLPDAERYRLAGEFAAATGADDAATRALARLFLDYSNDSMRSGPLCWSPAEVVVFLTDWLPRRVGFLDSAQRKALPATLRQWLTFVLTQRGTPEQWITPVLEAADESLADFRFPGEI